MAPTVWSSGRRRHTTDSTSTASPTTSTNGKAGSKEPPAKKGTKASVAGKVSKASESPSDGSQDQDPAPLPASGQRPPLERNGSMALLSASNTVEDFFASGLVQADGHGLMVVSHSETISSVLGQLHARRLPSCIVTMASGQQESFDCMDFAAFLLEAVLASPHGNSGLEDWESTKKKLRKVSTEPIRKALRGVSTGERKSRSSTDRERSPTRGGGASPGSPGGEVLRKFDADSGLLRLVQLFKTQRSVPTCRNGELCRNFVAGDILELCLSASEDTKPRLEQTSLEEVIQKHPSMISELTIFEDHSLLEAMQLMRSSSAHVVPILAGGFDSPTMGRQGSMGSNDSVTLNEAGVVVGQFDIASLRSLFIRSGDDSDSGSWWWEDSSITENIFGVTCVDFLALGPSSMVGDHAPYAAVLSSEPLARAISRATATTYQSVVVYMVDNSALRSSTGAGAPPGGMSSMVKSKQLQGLVSTQSLALALLEEGCFQTLNFDTSKPRRHKDFSRKPTLTAEDVEAVLAKEAMAQGQNDSNDRRSKVQFDIMVELDALAIPTCPEHGMPFMRFSKDEDPKNGMDFNILKDGVLESKATNATAHCIACKRSIGRISRRVSVPAVPGGGAAATATSGGGVATSPAGSESSLPGFGFAAAGDAVSRGQSDKVIQGNPPLRSSLKAGTPGAGVSFGLAAPAIAMVSPVVSKKSSGAAEKKVSSSPRSSKKPSDDKLGPHGSPRGGTPLESSGGSLFFFDMCCVSCSSSSKEQIAAVSSGKSTDYRKAGGSRDTIGVPLGSGGGSDRAINGAALDGAAGPIVSERSRRLVGTPKVR